MVKVVSNVPLPSKTGRGRPTAYPWATMKVGDSALFPEHPHKARMSAYQWKLRYPGWNYTTRTEPDGLRVWRTT